MLLLFVLFAYLLVSCTVTCITLIIILISQGNNDCFLDNIHLASMYLILPKMQKKQTKNAPSQKRLKLLFSFIKTQMAKGHQKKKQASISIF